MPAARAPQPHERVRTTEIAKQQLQQLFRAHDEPDPQLDVTAVATIPPYGHDSPHEAGGLANGSSTRLAHTVPREARRGAVRPGGRGDIATIAMPQLERGIPRLYDDHHDEHPTTIMPAVSAAALLARTSPDSSSGPRASATRDQPSALMTIDELAARCVEARRSQPRPVEPRPVDAMHAQPGGEDDGEDDSEDSAVDPTGPTAPSTPNPAAFASDAQRTASLPGSPYAPLAVVRRIASAPRWPVLRRSARSRLVVPVGLLLVLGSAAVVLMRAIF
ncbi:MAG TPA: hypothetical protein VFK02_12770 [Kofleriaceae bacterium]|nr:hypothetical protein [Kofleriaceae bacterium]